MGSKLITANDIEVIKVLCQYSSRKLCLKAEHFDLYCKCNSLCNILHFPNSEQSRSWEWQPENRAL